MMKLPKSLEPDRKRLLEALALPCLAEWPEQTAYQVAPQAAEIARIIIPVLHDHLLNARIRYLFREQLSDCSAKASRAGAKLEFLAEVDFLIEVNWTSWRHLSAEQRIALMDHELCHCGRDLEKEKYVLVEHDIEEFGSIVRRWGLWHHQLAKFGKAVKEQLELFTVPTAPADAIAVGQAVLQETELEAAGPKLVP